MITYGHVGTLKGPADQFRQLVVVEYLLEKHQSYLKDKIGSCEQAKHYDINLIYNKDYFEITEHHDIVILHFLFTPNQEHKKFYVSNNDFHSISKHHSPENWNKKLNESKADFIFAFGESLCEVNHRYFGDLENLGFDDG